MLIILPNLKHSFTSPVPVPVPVPDPDFLVFHTPEFYSNFLENVKIPLYGLLSQSKL